MRYIDHDFSGVTISEFAADDIVIGNPQQFLEVMMNSPSDRLVVHQRNLAEPFFDLRSGLAGEMLQKVVNYRMRLAIVGRFDGYESKSLAAFIVESNRSNVIAFVNTLEEALSRLAR